MEIRFKEGILKTGTIFVPDVPSGTRDITVHLSRNWPGEQGIAHPEITTQYADNEKVAVRVAFVLRFPDWCEIQKKDFYQELMAHLDNLETREKEVRQCEDQDLREKQQSRTFVPLLTQTSSEPIRNDKSFLHKLKRWRKRKDG